MIEITVHYFANLREQMKRSEDHLKLAEQSNVESAWEQATSLSLPDNILIAINQEYAAPTDLLNDGDEVAFFPPVTGG